ncbi:hypothetical protein Xinn_00151 [Xenorhabdus innexi]|uniref:Uncharacterized protein n=1 Tax=Xenorhabdus innexi TaxID=290109 RepID=A0ABX4LC15_9GAMM|nr:hypothetical protein Xinn_00151 [Xenorhabdus innexi]
MSITYNECKLKNMAGLRPKKTVCPANLFIYSSFLPSLLSNTFNGEFSGETMSDTGNK